MNMQEYTGKEILLVEDEALIALQEKRQLEKAGYRVSHVLKGEEAVTEVLESARKYDLILMDIDLGGGIDGTQAAEKILAETEIPVVFLSSHHEAAVVDKTEKITSYGYVLKSSSITVLDASIKMAFRLFEARCSEREKEEFLHSVFDNISHSIFVVDIDDEGEFRYAKLNRKHEELTGISNEEIAGKTPDDFFSENTAEEVKKHYQACSEARSQITYEECLPFRGRETYWQTTLSPLFNRQGEVYRIIGTSMDNTERRKRERERMRREVLLNRIQRLSRVGGWEWDVDNETMIWTAETYRLHGLDPEKLSLHPREHIAKSISCYRPEDRPTVSEAFNKCVEKGIPYDLKFPFTNFKGQKMLIRTSAEAVKVDGKIAYVVGNIMDLTDQIS